MAILQEKMYLYMVLNMRYGKTTTIEGLKSAAEKTLEKLYQ